MNRDQELAKAISDGLIEPPALHKLLGMPGLRILDASYGLTQGIDPDTVFNNFRIGDADRFNIDAVADLQASLPHTVPPQALFEEFCRSLGIGNDDFIVVYDQTGIAFAAARAWWMFRLFGHDRVCVLNGGLPAWLDAGLSAEPSALPVRRRSDFRTSFRPGLLVMIDNLKMNLSKPAGRVILDARSPGRFSGQEPEPRPGMRAGHIPGSINLPYARLLDGRGGLRNKAELAGTIDSALLSQTESITATCGSGVTACVIALAFFRQGRKDVGVYDGSWAEWGAAACDTPVEHAS